MPGSDPHPAAVGQRPRAGGLEDEPLLVETRQQSVGDLGDFFSAKDAYQVVDVGAFGEQGRLLAFGETPGDDDTPQVAAAFECQHFINGSKGLGPSGFDEPAGIYDGEIGLSRVADQLVTVELEPAEHSLAIHGVFGAAETNEGISALETGGAGKVFGERSRHLRPANG